MTPDELIQIADAAIASAYARAGSGSGLAAGEWMACRPGCHPCCVGVFPISALDAERLRAGLRDAPGDVRSAVLARAAEARERLIAAGFPGDAVSGKLFTEAEHEEAFEEFANDEVCPVLDPADGTCSLYASRPLPCRTFGPPMRNEEGGLGVCELCFVGAPAEEVARCAVDVAFVSAEAELSAELARNTGAPEPTLIAFAILG